MTKRGFLSLALLGLLPSILLSQDAAPPNITNFLADGSVRIIEWSRAPAINDYEIFGTDFGLIPLRLDTSGQIDGNRWQANNIFTPRRFWTLRYTPMTSTELLTANLLNRIAYGPSPDDIDHVNDIGPDAYIAEQLQPESLPPSLDNYTFVLTNSAPGAGDGSAWSSITVTGRITSSTLYMFLTEPGEVYIDDVSVRVLTVFDTTNGPIQNLSGNLLVNGDFESPLNTGWTVSANHANSSISTDVVCTGLGSLHMVATSPGSTRGSSIFQDISPELPVGVANRWCVMSFNYLPGPNSRDLTLRLSGSGTIISGMQEPEPPQWIYAEARGQATGTPRIYAYISGSGEAYLDSIKLVAGTDINAGPNLLINGDFEAAGIVPWQATDNFTGSYIDDTMAFEGNSSLHMVASAGGSGSGNSVFQTVAALQSGQTYTLGYWYRPATRGRTVTVRLSGSQLVSSPDTTFSGIRRRLDDGTGEIEDLRAWFVRNAVGSKKQLQQVLLQFLENHFVTQQSKSRDYLDRFYNDGAVMNQIATQWEYREIQKWSERLADPNCTFYDLLKVSAESPAMIVYMDTVDSRADGVRIANENYARELFELFCSGVDNGYDQNDIVAMSRAWTGWRVEIVDPENIDNPHAPRSNTYGEVFGSGYGGTSNLVGVWTFNYQPQFHGTNRAPIFSLWDPNAPGDDPVAIGAKTVDARFGSPWAGTPYQLAIPPRTGTSGIQDAYDVIEHLANTPHTMEYICVKLCRLFVHDGFMHGVYDYADPNRSEEAELVRQCMLAWWDSNPRGSIRPVLQTIFDSDLFRSHGGSMQKVKTPLEFTASTIRALRSELPDGTFTAETDGYDIVGTSTTPSGAPLTRMGNMLLFDRGDPDGYPEFGSAWVSAGTLAERIRFVQSFCIDVGDSGHTGSQGGLGNDAGNDNYCNPVALLKQRLPSETWRKDTEVVNLFLRHLYPAEGLGNLNQYRELGKRFLNTEDDGVTASPFSGLSDTSTTYDERVRGMVALLMSFQRFQEQ